MNRAEHSKLIYSGKYSLPLDSSTKKSYKIIIYRSEIENGKINNVELPELPENYYIIGASDLKGKNSFRLNGVKIPILALEKINYIGEPIFIILGSEISELKSIHKKIKITYEEEKIDQDPQIFFQKTIEPEKQEELNEIPYKSISGSISTPDKIIPVKYLHGSFTKRESDTLINYSSSIWESNLRDNLAILCNVDKSKIKIISPTITGENCSPLLDSYRSAFFTTLSASIIKKNVLYSPTPEDQFLFSSKIYGLKTDWKINFDIENRILGIELNATLNCGAYPILVKEKVARIIHGLTSYYKHRNIKITVTAIKSNLPPGGIVEDLYLSDALFTSELLISKLILECGKDQLHWRLNNLLKKGYKNSSNSIIKRDIPLEIMLTDIARQSDFSRKNSSINLSILRRDRRIQHSSNRGVGISVGYNGNSFIANTRELMTNGVTIKLNRDNKVDLYISCRINNLELLTLWEDTIIEILGVERDAITINSEDSSLKDDSAPNMGNKNVSILTPLIRQCCEELKVRRFKDPLPIIQNKQTRRKSSAIWNMETWKGEPFKNTSYSVCAVEVEVDKRSLSCKIKEIWLEIEVGQILNKTGLLNEINIEINRTIKWLQEPKPEIKNGIFSVDDFYNNVIIDSIPKYNITIHETGKNKNIPKGAGSLVKNSLPGAFIQAVNQAIGGNLNTFPVTKGMIYKELKKDEI